jgi:hypothetical protein
VDPVPDPLLLRKSGSVGNRTRTSGSVARTPVTVFINIRYLLFNKKFNTTRTAPKTTPPLILRCYGNVFAVSLPVNRRAPSSSPIAYALPRELVYWACAWQRQEDADCGLVVRVPGYRSRGPSSIPGAARFSEK